MYLQRMKSQSDVLILALVVLTTCNNRHIEKVGVFRKVSIKGTIAIEHFVIED